MENFLLSVEHLKKTYKTGDTELEVLSDISFVVNSGEVIALMGPSGVGKTTLLNIIGALDRPDSGVLNLNGEHIASLSPDKLASIRNRDLGFVFQFHHLLPEFNAIENVLIPGMIQGNNLQQRKEYAHHLLKIFGLQDRESHFPHELSGGEKQRVALARALMNQPVLVLADEPTGNLDRRTGAQLLAAILSFSQEHNQTFIIATHDEAIARKADRILLLENGIILETQFIESMNE